MSEFRVRVGAYGLVVQKGAMLLCRLGPRSNDDGWWTLPGGGMEFGEHPAQTVVRELMEETGFEVEVDGKPELFTEAFPELSLQTVCLAYRVRIVGGELRHEAEGSTDLCAWVPLSEAANLPMVSLAKWGVGLCESSAPA